jgi:DNA primase
MISAEKLKTIDAETVLNTLGLPYKKTGDRLMALATYRDENTASISIQKRDGKWLWKDFGNGKGGSWIDLVMIAKNLSYVEALKWLNYIVDVNLEINIEEDDKINRTKQSANISIMSIYSEVFSKNLINYMSRRGISLIPTWIKQINYTVSRNEQIYKNVALAVKNIKDGYALRNEKIKMNIGKSAYSLFSKGNQKELIYVVEGMFDGLTVAEKMKDRLYDLVILNSVQNLGNAVLDIISSYGAIVVGFDNDKAGQYAENKIKNNAAKNIYKFKFEAKDLNEALLLKEKIKIIKIK